MSGWTLTFQVANFVVLAVLLRRFLFKPVSRIIARRQEELERSTTDGARMRQEAEELRKEAQGVMAGLGEERNRTLTEARAEIERERNDVLAKARDEAAAIIETGRRDVEIERESAAETMVGAAVDIGVSIARRLLADVSTKHVTESFLDRICEHLDALPTERRAALSKELDGHELIVATAPPLSSDEQTRWLASITVRLGDGAKARFLNDDALVLGAELRFPQTTLSFCWRDSLRTAREELVHRDNTA